MRQSPSSSPDWDRPSPPERSRSGSNQPKPTRWQAKAPPEDCENIQKQKPGKNGLRKTGRARAGSSKGGKSNGRKKTCLWPRKGEWSDDWTDWSWEDRHQHAWSQHSQPQEKNRRLPKKEGAPGSSRTSGSYVQRQRLAKMREQNPPKSKEEAEQQRLAAIGRARFQRIHGRQQKHMAAKMEEHQANLEMQQQQLQQQLYWQQSQWQWQQPAVSWVLPQSGYLIHPGLTLYSCFSFRHAVLQP